MRISSVVRILCVAFAFGLASDLWMVDPASGQDGGRAVPNWARPAMKLSRTWPA